MIYELNGIKPKILGEVFIAESADIMGNVELNDGANIWFGAVTKRRCGENNYREK